MEKFNKSDYILSMETIEYCYSILQKFVERDRQTNEWIDRLAERRMDR